VSEKSSDASARGAFAELKEALGNLLGSVAGLAPEIGLAKGLPRRELRVEDEGYRVQVELPGCRREEIEVSVTGRTLTVSGERRRTELPEGTRLVRGERPHGRFEVSVRLPEEVDALGVTAQMRDGVLDVRLPRPGTRGRSIKVEAPEEAPGAGNAGPAMPWDERREPGSGGGAHG
jgi:HSP20 family protein